jgi:two-component system sensor histidine kinase DegS
VIKHAQATRVIVSVKRGPSGISVSIQDDGRGLNPQSLQTAPSRHERKPTLGLVSMAERAKLLAGEIEIQSAQGKGTRLTLTLPLPPLEKNGKTQMTHVE